MEKFELDFQGRRLRAYLSDTLEVYYDLKDIAAIVGTPAKIFAADFNNWEYITVDGRTIKVFHEEEIFRINGTLIVLREEFICFLHGEAQRNLRLSIANCNYEKGVDDKSSHTPAYQELDANFERVKKELAELQQLNRELINCIKSEVVRTAEQTVRIEEQLSGINKRLHEFANKEA